MKISIVTLFPQMFVGPFSNSIVKHAQEKKLVEISFVNLRDFGIGPHQSVDDTPYGGGHGMVLRVDVLEKALASIKDKTCKKNEEKVILLSARGTTYQQKIAKEFANLKHLILICGHYEGVDERITQFIDQELSIGDFVLTGGEIPAMLIADSVTRLVSGVLKEGVTDNESFTTILEYGQYTKPKVFKNLEVPEVLLLGNHKKISEWRKENAVAKTKQNRPDLLKSR